MSSEENGAANGSSAPPGLSKAARPPLFAKSSTMAGQDADSIEYLAKVEAAIVDFLSNKPDNAIPLPKLGIYLRTRNLTLKDGLKKFITGRPDVFQYIEEPNGTNRVALAPPPLDFAATSSSDGGMVTLPPGALPPGISEKHLERQLVTFILENATVDAPVNMPQLGEFCIKQLGFSMKGLMHRFLVTRRHLFQLPDDGRQHVKLQPGAAEAVGAFKGLPPLPDDLLGSGSGPGGSRFSSSAIGVVGPETPSPLKRPSEYPKWDRLTQEMYDFVVSKGGLVPFKDVDVFMKSHCADLIRASGVDLSLWQSSRHSWKRRNIFRKEGQMLGLNGTALHGVPEKVGKFAADREKAAAGGRIGGVSAFINGSGGNSSNEGFKSVLEDLFPSLETGARPARKTLAGAAGGSSISSESPADTAAALAAFATERKAMEQLRDEVQSSLTSLKALSELQKENAGLRAACITLGRELLSLKDEMTAMKSHLAAKGIYTTTSTASPTNSIASPASTAADAMFLDSLESAAATADAAAGAVLSGFGSETKENTVVIIGGHDGVSWLDSIETFYPGNDAWSALPAMPQPRSFCAATAAPDGSIYVTGGGKGADWYDTSVRLLSGGANWQTLAKMSVGRGSLASAHAQGYLYAYGGGKPGTQYNIVECYDAENDRWVPGPALTSKRFALSGASLNGCLYAIGGYDGTAYLNTVERLDPREGRWMPVASMAQQRGGHGCTVAGSSQIYIFGGYFKTAIQGCEVYDVRANSWRTIAQLPDCRAYGAAAASSFVNDSCDVFVLGGLNSDMQTHASLVQKYSPKSNSWSEVELPAHVNPRRSFLAACALPGN